MLDKTFSNSLINGFQADTFSSSLHYNTLRMDIVRFYLHFPFKCFMSLVGVLAHFECTSCSAPD